MRQWFTNVEAYRQNSASIRVRIVDQRFVSKSRTARDRMVLPLLRSLPQETQDDITVLLLLTPEEQPTSMMNVEFDHPVRSSL